MQYAVVAAALLAGSVIALLLWMGGVQSALGVSVAVNLYFVAQTRFGAAVGAAFLGTRKTTDDERTG